MHRLKLKAAKTHNRRRWPLSLSNCLLKLNNAPTVLWHCSFDTPCAKSLMPYTIFRTNSRNTRTATLSNCKGKTEKLERGDHCGVKKPLTHPSLSCNSGQGGSLPVWAAAAAQHVEWDASLCRWKSQQDLPSANLKEQAIFNRMLRCKITWMLHSD